MLTKFARLTLIAAGLASVPAAAAPQQPWLNMTQTDDEIAARISYADLDLKSPSGAQALHYRVGYASNEICSSALDDGVRRTNYSIASRNCTMDLVAANRSQVDNVLRRSRVQIEVTSLIISFGR